MLILQNGGGGEGGGQRKKIGGNEIPTFYDYNLLV